MPPKKQLYTWFKQDVEQRFRFTGGKFTDTNTLFTLLMGTALSACLLVVLRMASGMTRNHLLADKFLDRGIIPYIILLFFSWSLVVLWVKGRKLAYQRSLLTVAVIPTDSGFVLTPKTAPECLQKMEHLVDAPERFILFNRIEVALSNLSNIGNISDVSTILSSQSQKDEQLVASSFTLISGFIWAIPVFGFIGTVMGLADAIQGFGTTLQVASDMEAIKTSMTLVVQGLSTAFDTTFLALVAAVLLQILVSFQKRREIRFLDECDIYCQQQILNKLRLIDHAP